jgi:hypothetical protein
VQKGGSAAETAHDEKRLFDGLLLVGREEHIVQQQKAPGRQRVQRPEREKEEQKAPAFGFLRRTAIVLRPKDGAYRHVPEELDVISHRKPPGFDRVKKQQTLQFTKKWTGVCVKRLLLISRLEKAMRAQPRKESCYTFFKDLP